MDRCFTDRASGKDVARPELIALKCFVREGDTVMVHSMDRLPRNLDDLRQTVKELTARGVCIEFVKERLKFTGEDSPMAQLMLSVMGAFAEFARSLLLGQREGITLAQQLGVYRVHKPSLDGQGVADLQRRVAEGERKSDIARDLGICRETLYAYLRKPALPAARSARATAKRAK